MKKRKQNLPRPAVHRMELWWAALPTVPGHVQRGTRPVVIVSNDLGNASSPAVSVVPCTTQRHKPALPTHVYLRGYGLSSGSIAMCEQVMPLDKSCLLRHIGTVYGMTGWLSSTLWPRSLASTSVSIWQHNRGGIMRSISMAYPTIDLAATGAHIRQLRLEQGYSIQDLQAYLGLEHPQAIYHWQHGRNLPSVDNLYALSKPWGVPMDKIIVEQAA